MTTYIIIGVIAVAAIIGLIVKAHNDKVQRIMKAEAEREHRIEVEKREKAARVEQELREAREKREQEARQREFEELEQIDLEAETMAIEEAIDNLIKEHPEGKRVTLAGKPEEFATPSLGDDCEVSHDYEKDRYEVLSVGEVIGLLPAAAIRYAEAHDKDPEDLDVTLIDIEYDIEKDRDIYTVFIF